MNHAAVSPYTQKTHELLVESYTKIAKHGVMGIDPNEYTKSWNGIRSEFAKLIHGDEQGVVVTSSTSSSLHLAAEGFSERYKEGNNIVITELEFTANSFVWQKTVKKFNMELRVASFTNNSFDQLEQLIDENTIIVAISFVQYSNGYRANIKKISQLCKRNNSLLILDAIQGLGIVPFDANDLGVDIVATGSYKWLQGPLGGGYFYIRPKLLDEMNSILVSWFGDQTSFKVKHREFDPYPDAREYQVALSPLFRAFENSLKMINNLNPSNIYKHVTRLNDIILQKLENNKQFENLSDFPNENRSGILTFSHPEAKKIGESLSTQGVVVTVRDGTIRISPHWHNDEEQINKLTSILTKF